MKEFLATVLHRLGQAYWVEITTTLPQCIYYFGPFLLAQEAEAEMGGYLEDLEQEGAIGIVAVVKRCKPTELTITDDWGDGDSNGNFSPDGSLNHGRQIPQPAPSNPTPTSPQGHSSHS
ncbi:DUF1816 domain-containing protein [Prochlorothrix hollandica]|uniref:DUF1816 domain-containing protein n=1 Tax=Prochlorothrix hollandica TaxID=1223 RepID=UPI003DA70E73